MGRKSAGKHLRFLKQFSHFKSKSIVLGKGLGPSVYLEIGKQLDPVPQGIIPRVRKEVPMKKPQNLVIPLLLVIVVLVMVLGVIYATTSDATPQRPVGNAPESGIFNVGTPDTPAAAPAGSTPTASMTMPVPEYTQCQPRNGQEWVDPMKDGYPPSFCTTSGANGNYPQLVGVWVLYFQSPFTNMWELTPTMWPTPTPSATPLPN